MFKYALYVYVASIITYGEAPLATRLDDFQTAAEVQNLVENPHYYYSEDNDVVLMYMYGECYKGREPTQKDLDFEVSMAGGDCNDCVCWNTTE